MIPPDSKGRKKYLDAIVAAHVAPASKVYALPAGTPSFSDMLKAVLPEYPLDYDDYHADLIRRAQNLVDHVCANRGDRHAGKVHQFMAGPPNTFKTTVIGIGLPIYAIGRNRNIRGITMSEDKDLASPSVDKMRNIMLHNDAYVRMFGKMKFETEKRLDRQKWTEHAFTVVGRTELHEEPTWSSVGYRSFPAKHHYDIFIGDDPHAEASQRMKDKVWEMTKQIPQRMEPWGGFFGIANIWDGIDWSFHLINDWSNRWTDDPLLRPLSDGTEEIIGETPEGKPITRVISLIPKYWTNEGAQKLKDDLVSEGSLRIWAYQYMLDRTKAGDTVFRPDKWEHALAPIGTDPGMVHPRELSRKILIYDPASGSSSDKSSEGAFHVGAWRPRGSYYICDAYSGRWRADEFLDAMELLVKDWQPFIMGVEKVFLSEYLVRGIETRLAELRIAGFPVPYVVPVHHNQVSKVKRIEGWVPDWNRGYVQVNPALKHMAKFRQQILSFPKCAGEIMDLLDAWAYGLTLSIQEKLIPAMTELDPVIRAVASKDDISLLIDADRKGYGRQMEKILRRKQKFRGNVRPSPDQWARARKENAWSIPSINASSMRRGAS